MSQVERTKKTINYKKVKVLINAQSDLEEFLAKETNEVLEIDKENKTSLNTDDKNKDYFIPEEEITAEDNTKEKVDPFKEAELINSKTNNVEKKVGINESNANTSLISRLSNVKNKAIDVGQSFSMVRSSQ